MTHMTPTIYLYADLFRYALFEPYGSVFDLCLGVGNRPQTGHSTCIVYMYNAMFVRSRYLIPLIVLPVNAHRSKKKKTSRKLRAVDSDDYSDSNDSDSSSDDEAERAKRRKKAKKEKVSAAGNYINVCP